ncbi:MAG: exopolysaccharide biosynthesis polyprenyl glycosylphosphotransferase [bacterium]|nr:exopolysaccharide biosynthesis polyprenyl glycosylphosphotransferase [bacterium]
MYSTRYIKQALLLTGDIIILYFSLAVTLLLRYGAYTPRELRIYQAHLFSFSAIFALWIFIFYVAGLYDLRTLKNDLRFAKNAAGALVIAALIAIFYFYFIPALITPKTNLIIHLGIFAAVGGAWRVSYNKLLGLGGSKERLLLVGAGPVTEELITHIEQNPQLGYKISYHMKGGLNDPEFKHLAQIFIDNKISTVVIPSHIKKNLHSARVIYHQLALGISVIDVATLYERVFEKVPLAETEEVWLLDNIAEYKRAYDSFVAPLERAGAMMLFILLLPLTALIGSLIILTSGFPVLHRQTRVGKYGVAFTLYKFRSMRVGAETHGAEWAKEHDPRATFIGAALRYTHLDELPQLWNIIIGDVSFVGPRPERPEFVDQLKKEIPFYELRQLVNPGVTGWAQINYRYGASARDAYEKLQYDLYYMKNRSFFLDVTIILKTLKLLLVKIT